MSTIVQQNGAEAFNYSLALAAIPEDYRLMSRRILTWIAIASCPLTVLELADACTIDWRVQPAVDETRSEHAYLTLRLLESSELVHMGSLPKGHKYKYFHRDTGCGQLVDASFRDYLISEDAIPDFRMDEEQAHFEIAQDCIAYLCQFYTAERSGRARPDGSSNHFLRYAREHWDNHQRKAEQALDDRACLGLVEAFLMDEQMRADWVRPRPSTDGENSIGSALYWSCALGIPATTERLLARGYHVDEVGGDYGTAIQISAWRGRSEIVKRLLAVGADVSYDQGQWGTALQAACNRGPVEIVVMLLNAGADVNAGSSRARNPPLTIACRENNDVIVEHLLFRGADINAQGPYTKAMCTKNSSSFLPRPGTGIRDHDEERGHHETALQAAAANGSISIVKQLIAHGAIINVQGGSYGNPLRAAIYEGRNEVINLLLDNGADVGLLPPHLLVNTNYTISRAVAQRLFSAGIQSLRRERFHQQYPLKSAVEGEGLIQEDVPDPTLALDDFDMFRHANGLDGDRGIRRLQPYH